MSSPSKLARCTRLGLLLIVCATWPSLSHAQTNRPAPQIRVVEIQGVVDVLLEGKGNWRSAVTNQLLHPFDHIRTGPRSRVALRWSDQSVIPFTASTELEVLPPQGTDSDAGLHLIRGVLSFFHRDQPGRIRVITRGATAGIEGTEFVLAVNDSDRTTVSVVDGKVRFGNEQATLVLTNGQQAIAEVGHAPEQTAGFLANNVLQWCFYYPAVLDPAELQLSADEQSTLADSLNAYRSGDLLQALAKYPAGRQPASDSERVYYAALLLSVGQVDQTETALAALLAGNDRPQQLAAALRTLIAAVKRTEAPSALNHQLSTSLLASSYYEQSRATNSHSLDHALDLARSATTNSPQFGFAWERLAELEFSFGRTGKSMDALDKALALSPRNAQGLTLKGFLLSSQNRSAQSIEWFDRALAVDSALGNAWLGRGLNRIKRGDISGGREDLLIAAALEPQRAELRTYLGKAHETAGDYPHAEKELLLAKQLDPQDPTPYLYSALINQENSRVNDAIRDLEKSAQLNDNRSVYRSQLLLNQDNAVRSANLAAIYQDAGMNDVAVREAQRAVTYDYANYSGHLFLANSYNQLRDNHGFGVNLRYETPTLDEMLVANLLAPVDAGPLSPTVSQSEYSRMFERNRLGFVSDTTYLSRGAWNQTFAQFGTYDTFNYSVDGIYSSDPGQAINNDSELKQISLRLKQQIAPQDTVSLQVELGQAKTGDVFQHYNGAATDHDLRSFETHEPILRLGYHHEWSPGVHTLLLLGRDVDRASSTTSNYLALVTSVTTEGEIVNLRYDNDVMTWAPEQELYSAELQQIFEQNNHNTVIGGLYQHTDLDVLDYETTFNANYFLTNPIHSGTVSMDFERFSAYGYHSWQILDPILLVGGISYDYMILPLNWNLPPVSDRTQTKDQVSPKAGIVWTPARNTTVRFAYTRSLTGMSFDQSIRLEPTQVAGLNQSYRNVISDSIAGATSGARLETFGLSLEQKFDTGTYLGLSGELLYSDVNRLRGSYYDNADSFDDIVGSSDFMLRERLHSRERSIIITADQLIDKEWSIGGQYRLTDAELNDDLVDVNVPIQLIYNDDLANPDVVPHQRLESLLHQLNLHLNFNHASGFFSTLEAVWYYQHNSGFLRKSEGDINSVFSERDRGDDFWQFNLIGGYRFYHRRAIISAGILNLTDRDYRLSPLTYYNELPRERTFMARLQLNF